MKPTYRRSARAIRTHSAFLGNDTSAGCREGPLAMVHNQDDAIELAQELFSSPTKTCRVRIPLDFFNLALIESRLTSSSISLGGREDATWFFRRNPN